MSIGLALSGGGSRAAGFHAGTLKGLEEVGLLDGVDAVSTVSGGSLFGAAWVISKKNGTELDAFLAIMANELAKGFVGRSLQSWNLFRVPFPGYDRTNLFADAFDRVFFNWSRSPFRSPSRIRNSVHPTDMRSTFSVTSPPMRQSSIRTFPPVHEGRRTLCF